MQGATARRARRLAALRSNQDTTIEPQILTPSGLDPSTLDTDALRAVQRLQARGFETYFVGGCVRDLLLGRAPKDFDLATGARPQQVKRTFPRNCRIIGRRFKLAHLHFEQNRKILEVATFRTSPTEDGESGDLLITRDNEFGTAEEDALRRDFTANALFYDPVADEIIDYVGGLADVRERVLRTIGDPVVRFREDPVRIIRAAKFSGRLGFSIDEPTYEAMAQVAPDLARSAPPRLLEEVLRLLRGGHALESFQMLRDIGALRVVLPVVSDFLADAPEPDRVRFWRFLEALDEAVADGTEVSSPVLLGALFACPVRARSAREPRRSATTIAESLIGPFAQELRLPRRDAGCLKRICGVQPRFTGEGGHRFKLQSFLRDPYFAEALQLFELSCAAGAGDAAALARWRALAEEVEQEEGDDVAEVEFSAEDSAEDDETPTDEDGDDRPRRRRRRSRRGRRRRAGAEADGDASAHFADDEEIETDATPAATAEGEATAPEAEGEERAPRRRRRRRRGRGGEEPSEEPATAAGGEAADSDRSPGEEQADQAAEAEESAGDGDAPRRRRSRRGRRGKRGTGGAATAGDEQAAAGDDSSGERSQSKAKKKAGKKAAKVKKTAATKKAGKSKRGKKASSDGDGRRDRTRASKSRRRRGRADRDNAVDTIEPAAIDVSAFDVELGPRDVPTFGVIIEDSDAPRGGRKKKRAPRSTPPEADDSYRPPPPPGTDPAPPPPPPPPADDDEFGDW